MKSTDYLQAVKVKLNLSSDYALAKALKVTKQTAGKYARGEVIPGPVIALRVAAILEEQPAVVISAFESERAERDGKLDEIDEWKGWMQKIGGGVASILLAAGFGGIPNAGADLPQSSNSADIYIV